jgi:Family of unknown function (DUF5682)
VTQAPGAVHVFGVRHHGPGSARSLAVALATLRPDIILVEGPPEADPLAALAADGTLRPPVALLGYVPGQPGQAAFWPFAAFSPEWQALRYAADTHIPVRFMDLPAANMLATGDNPENDSTPAPRPHPAPQPTTPTDDGDPASRPEPAPERIDPIAALAAAAGYDDPERWWEDAIEHAVTGEPSVFDAITEAITMLRDQPGAGPADQTEARREAHMRRKLRAAVKEGHDRIAVVCGAWHAPALLDWPPAAHDDRLLRGLPSVKVALTWVPWTYGRLASWSGYGAGIRSPGWYHHLFETQDRPIERWLTKAAGVLRDDGVPASSAHVIEAVRLAEALAALRGRPLAGLEEVTEAARAVLCEGSELAVRLIQRRLVVGERMGTVPAATPMVPLQRDVADQQRSLKLRPAAEPRDHDLDLRKPTDLGRSRLLHRLALLGVRWGTRRAGPAGKGTFRESWQLAWQPELDLALIEASMWGTTVATAAAARVAALAVRSGSLAELTRLTERSLLAGLAGSLPGLLAAVRERAALDTDVTSLMTALPALVRAARYGDVRGTDTARLAEVATEMITRICAGLPLAVASLDSDAEREMRGRIDAVHAAVALLADPPSRQRWEDTLVKLADRDTLAPLVGGRLVRLLLDAGALAQSAAAQRMTRELSAGVPPARAAAWAEGFLAGSGLLLVHDDALLSLVDGWLAALTSEQFLAVLPALRRTFGDFAPPERRAIGDQAARLDGSGHIPDRPADPSAQDDDLDLAHAAAAVVTVASILGLTHLPEPVTTP